MRPVGILSLKGVEDVKNCNSSAKTRAAFLRAHGNDHPRRQPLSGAHAAKTNLFADLMVATSDDSVKKQWQDGLRLIREEAARSSLAGALRKAAVNEGNPQTDLEQFVALPKQMAITHRDGNPPAYGIPRQHLPPCLSRMHSSRTPGLMRLNDFLFSQTRVFQAATADPLENGPVLVARFVSVPALAAVVRRQVITYVAGAVGRPGGFDQYQTLVRVGDVHHAHRVAVIFFAVLIREDALGIGWRQLEDHVAGMAEHAGFAVRAGFGQDGFDLGDKVAEVEHGAGLRVLRRFAQVLSLQHAGADELETRIAGRLQLLNRGMEIGSLLHALHFTQRIQRRGADVGVGVQQGG